MKPQRQNRKKYRDIIERFAAGVPAKRIAVESHMSLRGVYHVIERYEVSIVSRETSGQLWSVTERAK